jgi:opacity protein-like surface antigen
MKLKLFVATLVVTFASQAIAPAWAAPTSGPMGPATNIVVAGITINPFCIALQIKTGRPCKP